MLPTESLLGEPRWLKVIARPGPRPFPDPVPRIHPGSASCFLEGAALSGDSFPVTAERQSGRRSRAPPICETGEVTDRKKTHLTFGNRRYILRRAFLSF